MHMHHVPFNSLIVCVAGNYKKNISSTIIRIIFGRRARTGSLGLLIINPRILIYLQVGQAQAFWSK